MKVGGGGMGRRRSPHPPHTHTQKGSVEKIPKTEQRRVQWALPCLLKLMFRLIFRSMVYLIDVSFLVSLVLQTAGFWIQIDTDHSLLSCNAEEEKS